MQKMQKITKNCKKDVFLLALSTASKSIPDGFEIDETKNEMMNASKILGLSENARSSTAALIPVPVIPVN